MRISYAKFKNLLALYCRIPIGALGGIPKLTVFRVAKINLVMWGPVTFPLKPHMRKLYNAVKSQYSFPTYV